MWPWEHLAVGYLCYSLGVRALGRDPPGDGEAVVLSVATQIPDLVDKPLSWELNWFPSGYAVGHSVFLALPLSLLAVVSARRLDRPRWGAAALVGYWSHLVGDVLSPLRSGESPLLVRVLWPISDAEPYESDLGLGRGAAYLDEFVSNLATMDPLHALLLYGLLPLAMVALWILDGTPGAAILARTASRIRRRS